MLSCFLAVAFSAAEPFVPCFSDIPSVEAARVHLHAVGVETFFAEVQKAKVAPPSIHSKYWVDTLPTKATEERKREITIHPFGLGGATYHSWQKQERFKGRWLQSALGGWGGTSEMGWGYKQQMVFRAFFC